MILLMLAEIITIVLDFQSSTLLSITYDSRVRIGCNAMENL